MKLSSILEIFFWDSDFFGNEKNLESRIAAYVEVDNTLCVLCN